MDDIHPQDIQTHDNTLKFSFLASILGAGRMRQGGSVKLQAISHSSQSCPKSQNALGMLRRVIISESQQRIYNKQKIVKKDELMMKGKMMIGSKKPLDSQMTSLLQNINQRIHREIQKSNKQTDFPQIYPQNKQFIDQTNIDKKQGNFLQKKSSILLNELPQIKSNEQQSHKYHYKDIFKNLKQMRFTRRMIIPSTSAINQEIKQSTKNINTNNSNNNIRTISYSSPQKSKNKMKLLNSNPIQVEQKQIILKKGYLPYDLKAKQFLIKNRNNIKSQIKQIEQYARQITASSYLILNSENLMPFFGKKINQSIEIASISKVMTCYLSLLICKKYEIDVKNHKIRINEQAAESPGTSAQLQTGDILTVYELLMGMMLPSGNDAAVALGEGMGKIISKARQKRQTLLIIQSNKKQRTFKQDKDKIKQIEDKKNNEAKKIKQKKSYLEIFISQMNYFTKQCNLNQKWRNPSGLSTKPNHSTVQSICILTAMALKNQIFKQIINTKEFNIQIHNQRLGISRKSVWRNTNKLLGQGWSGVKTGTTETAGHCFMGLRSNILICTFNCQTLGKRFSQCVKLYKFYQQLVL